MNAENGTALFPFSSTISGTLLTGLIVCALATLAPKTSEKIFRRVERSLARFAARRALTVCALFFGVAAIRLMLLPLLPVPVPGIHDEFSYLLMADTFVHGRLANPPHPMWISFETFHVNWFPTYMSMYPPAQGLVLALGQLLGHPWIGQLLVTAAMCSALCWALQAWLPPAWALLGGMLAVLRLGILSYWVNGYWSASVVALGGALVLGALPRIQKHSRARDATLMSLGLALMADSRPYEGLVFSIPPAGAMILWLFRTRLTRRTLTHALVPIIILLSLFSAATGYYYYRVIGSPFRMTYQVNRETYSTAPYFLLQQPPPEPTYNHIVMRD